MTIIVIAVVLIAIAGWCLDEYCEDKRIQRASEKAYAEGNWEKYERRHIMNVVE